jgi:hypothetical protein
MDCLTGLLDVVRRYADQHVGADDFPNVGDWQVILADVNAIGMGQRGEVGAVVHDE